MPCATGNVATSRSVDGGCLPPERALRALPRGYFQTENEKEPRPFIFCFQISSGGAGGEAPPRATPAPRAKAYRLATSKGSAITEQAIEHTFAAKPGAGLDQHRQDTFDVDRLREGFTNPVEQVTERCFAVGITNRAVKTRTRREVGQLAVVRKTPVAPPQLANKRVGIGQAHLAHVGLTDMANHHFAFDRVPLHQQGDLGVATGARVLEQAQATAFIEGNAPAIAVRACTPATLHQAGKAEHNIGRDVGAHAQ